MKLRRILAVTAIVGALAFAPAAAHADPSAHCPATSYESPICGFCNAPGDCPGGAGGFNHQGGSTSIVPGGTATFTLFCPKATHQLGFEAVISGTNANVASATATWKSFDPLTKLATFTVEIPADAPVGSQVVLTGYTDFNNGAVIYRSVLTVAHPAAGTQPGQGDSANLATTAMPTHPATGAVIWFGVGGALLLLAGSTLAISARKSKARV
jgi:hypothetical protein